MWFTVILKHFFFVFYIHFSVVDLFDKSKKKTFLDKNEKKEQNKFEMLWQWDRNFFYMKMKKKEPYSLEL